MVYSTYCILTDSNVQITHFDVLVVIGHVTFTVSLNHPTNSEQVHYNEWQYFIHIEAVNSNTDSVIITVLHRSQ